MRLDVVTQTVLPNPVWLCSCCLPSYQIFLICPVELKTVTRLNVFNSCVLNEGYLLSLKYLQHFHESKRLLQKWGNQEAFHFTLRCVKNDNV